MDLPINIFGVNATPPNNESITITTDAISPEMSEDEFLVASNERIARMNNWHNAKRISARGDINYKYYLGDQVDVAGLRDDLEKWVENEIFQNIETLIPIVTKNTPDPSTTPVYKNEYTRKFAADLRRMLRAEWEIIQDMQQILGPTIRNHQARFLAVWQLGYDPETREVWTELIPTNQIMVDEFGTIVVKTCKNKTLGDLVKMFPDKKASILSTLGLPQTAGEFQKTLQSPVEYSEIWMDNVVGYKLQTLVLGVDKNPHFDYSGHDMEVGVDEMEQPVMGKVKFNYFKAPKMPFIFLRYYSFGRQTYDETTIVEQSLGLQNWINKRKRQIGANADSTNGHWVSSGDFIAKDEFLKITGGIDEKIWLENGLPADGLAKITGQELPGFVYNDLTDSRQTLSTLMGVENTTLGAPSKNKTLGQDVMQQERNIGRLDGYVRDGIERLAEEWYEWVYHLYLVYTDEDQTIAVPETDDIEVDNIVFSRSTVPIIQKKNGEYIICPILINVKQGSTLPDDEASDYAKTQQVKELLSPMDLFKRLGFSNPRELAKNKIIHDMDPLAQFANDPDIQALLAKKQQEKQDAMVDDVMTDPGPNGAAPGMTPPTPPQLPGVS